MYAVQSRVNGAIIDEERCATLPEAWDAMEARRRLLVTAGAAIVADEPRQCLVVRVPEGWISVTLLVKGPR